MWPTRVQGLTMLIGICFGDNDFNATVRVFLLTFNDSVLCCLTTISCQHRPAMEDARSWTVPRPPEFRRASN